MAKKKSHGDHHGATKGEHKESKKSESSSKKNVYSVNPWVISTVVLAILLVFFLIPSSSNQMSPEAAGQKFVEFLKAKGTDVSYVSAKDFSDDLYEVTVKVKDKDVPAHVTKDGKYFVQIVFPLDSEEGKDDSPNKEPTPDVVKSDKPVVDLFVMSYCPYGTQAEKGIIPALEALGDSVDFTLRFVYYAMHPTKGEVEENLRQYCIQKDEKDKLLPYLKCFLDKGDSDTCLTSVGIDKTKLDSCTTSADAEFNVMSNLENKDSWLNGRFPLFDIDKELNTKYGIGGSPTLVINGAQAKSSRDPTSYLNTICAAFNDAPEVCSSSDLPTKAYSPGFGYDTTSSGSDASCG